MEAEMPLMRWTVRLIFVLMVILSTPITAKSQSSSRIIEAKWLDSPPVIDGALSESVWGQAEIATDFFRAKQTRGIPAKLNTKAMILYDADALYIGVHCDEPNMKNLRETQTRRDAWLLGDDTFNVLLDTFNDQRNCYVLAVNTLGTQMDQRVSNESKFDPAWDANWEAKVQKNGNHWTAEMAIPFSELRFNPQMTTWGINFWRRHPMEGEQYSWSDTGGSLSRVSDFGKLANLDFSRINTDRKVGILPYITHRAATQGDSDQSAGIDFIIPMSTNITTNVTFNPDFSQLEADPTRINISADRELFLPERRPFFREGAELFDLPLNLFYTRRVQEIDYGVKSTGRVGDCNFALIDTYGTMIDRYDGDKKKGANLFAARVNRNIGERSMIGAMGIQKHQVDRDVTLFSLDGRFALHHDWIARSQYVVDALNGEGYSAYHTSMNWNHESGWGGRVRLEEIEDGFRPNETGLEEEAFRNLNSRLWYRHRFDEGSTIRSVYVGGRHFHQTNAEKLLRRRRVGLVSNVGIGRFDLYSYGGYGEQRDEGQLYDRKQIGARLSYRPKWGRMRLSNEVGTRQDKFHRYTKFSTNLNLFSRLTINFDLNNLFWRDHQNTLIFRFRGNYQFTRQIGWRVFVERVDERLDKNVNYNFNSIFDYQFTPESRLFVVLADSTDGERAVLTKMSYLFESGFPL